ncbi:collagen alpha-4(VI) chain-like [Argonauta hians]
MASFLLLALCLALCHFGNALPFTEDSKQCENPADIVFLLDCSTSMKPAQFKKQLAFMVNFTESMDIDSGAIRIAAVTFGTKVWTDFHLNKYKTKDELQEAISKILYCGGRTHTWLALEHISKEMFTTDNGGRIGVPKIVIMTTDGGSNEKRKTLLAAEAFHKEPIRVYTIGIGNSVDEDELKAISSKESNVFMIDNFDALKSITSDIVQNVCVEVCGVNPTDIIFMLDESTSILNEDFNLQLGFVSSFIKDSIVGVNATQIGIVTFSTNVTTRIKLNQYSQSKDLVEAVDKIQRKYGNTNTGEGLKLIREEGFSKENGGRDDAAHIVIVITDGQAQSRYKTLRESTAIHQTEIVVFTLGVGDDVDPEELKAIASSDDKMFAAASYSILKDIEKALFSKVCRIEVVGKNQ